MADIKISSLASATSVTGAELVPIVQTGANKKATLSVVKDYVISDSSLLKDTAIGVTVQGYDADLTSWAAIATSAKQDTLVSGTNIKTVNGSSLLGAGDLTISGGGGTPGGATTQVQFNDAGAFAGASGLTIDSATGAIKTATDTVYELVGTAVSASNGALQFKTLSGATTLTESLASGQAVTLEIYAGAFSVTWPTVYWLNTTSSTTAPILNTTGPTIIELWKRGTTLYGSKVA